MTAVANSAFTASQFNAHVRDNLLETAPAKATTSGSIFVGTGSNAIAERVLGLDTISTQEATSSTSFVNLATVGPAVTLTTGTSAIVFIGARAWNDTASGIATMGVAVSGSSTISATEDNAYMVRSSSDSIFVRAHAAVLFDGTLTAGSNTFTAKYRAATGEGSWRDRSLLAIPL
ncbi:hypothetical protein GCM10022254_10070 [Actinomadura meridiana]|uniref:Uncharacterized protein n=1 Tax=Actinomadura meridiana TaxID=559626 RepID=A0ABP8BTU8_9ACTN